VLSGYANSLRRTGRQFNRCALRRRVVADALGRRRVAEQVAVPLSRGWGRVRRCEQPLVDALAADSRAARRPARRADSPCREGDFRHGRQRLWRLRSSMSQRRATRCG